MRFFFLAKVVRNIEDFWAILKTTIYKLKLARLLFWATFGYFLLQHPVTLCTDGRLKVTLTYSTKCQAADQ